MNLKNAALKKQNKNSISVFVTALCLGLGTEEQRNEEWRGATGIPARHVGPGWLVGVPLVKVGDELRINDVASKDLGPFLRIVTIPVDQVQNTSALAVRA